LELDRTRVLAQLRMGTLAMTGSGCPQALRVGEKLADEGWRPRSSVHGYQSPEFDPQ
jgi:hypothetical protein